MSVQSSITNKTYDSLEPFAQDLEQGTQEQIDASLAPILEEIRLLNQRIGELSGSISQVDSRVDSLSSDVSTLSSDVSTLSSEISTLSTTTSTTTSTGTGTGTGSTSGGTSTEGTAAPLTIVTNTLGPVENRRDFNFDGRAENEVTVTGGVPPYTFELTTNPLDISIDNTGIVTGFVNVSFPGSYDIEVTATDASGSTASKTFTIQVAQATQE